MGLPPPKNPPLYADVFSTFEKNLLIVPIKRT